MRLDNERYEEIKKEVAYLFEDYDINSISIDVFEIARKMKIKVVFASEILNKNKDKITEYTIYSYPQSYLHYDEQKQRFIVYIDDIGTTLSRQRFSLAHEIMHIRLGHHEQNERNEAEANFGAQYMLVPTSLVLLDNEFHVLQEEIFIKHAFNVSDSVAEISVRYNQNRIKYVSLEPKDYEEIINNKLRESFLRILPN